MSTFCGFPEDEKFLYSFRLILHMSTSSLDLWADSKSILSMKFHFQSDVSCLKHLQISISGNPRDVKMTANSKNMHRDSSCFSINSLVSLIKRFKSRNVDRSAQVTFVE